MDKNIRSLKGVGEKRAQCFEKLGVTTVSQLTRLLPRRYEDLGNITDISELAAHRGEKVSVVATVCLPVKETRIKGSNTLTAVYAEDLSGTVRIVYFNNKFIKNMIKQGERYLFYGTVPKSGPINLTNPDFYKGGVEQDKSIIPIYPLVSGLNRNFMRKAVLEALKQSEFTEPLPEWIIQKYRLCPLCDAIHNIHSPKKWEDVYHARRRLIFEELLYFSLGLRLMRCREKKKALITVTDIPYGFVHAHDFSPTVAQDRALNDIYKDLASGQVMNRLLQGDVGSGKTFVAGQCAFTVIKSGAQAVMMVPTEVLANQHYKYFNEKFSALGLNVVCLTASVAAAQKRKIKQMIADGTADFVIGTHALLQQDVTFSRLGLVITDEQHRFGVMQRSALAGKSDSAHMLVMSATPIPRTLALMLWGDLDLSVIDVMPAGRQKVSTYLVDLTFGDRLNAFMQKNIDAGGRVYVVCPMIEENDEVDITGAKERYQGLCKIFGESRVGIVHGKMKAADKDKAMGAFANGDIDILVSTTVIEVGVNVPEATLMIIENAERFGLSQLHQLRGRVGRGSKKSYCVLVSEQSSERLEYFTKTTDGFKIAQKDLELRGPGNLFGKDQHGLPTMSIADMQEDMQELKMAAECAGTVLEIDPGLAGCPEVRRNVLSLFETKGEIFN